MRSVWEAIGCTKGGLRFLHYGGDEAANIIDLSVHFGDMVDPKKESNKQGSGHCTKMQAILRLKG